MWLSARSRIAVAGQLARMARRPAQEGAISAPFGRLAGRSTAVTKRPRHRTRRSAETVFVIVGIEQPQLLAAVHGVEGVSMSSTIRLGTCRRTRSTGQPSPDHRSRDRTSGKFSRREMVGCDTAPGPTARGRAPSRTGDRAAGPRRRCRPQPSAIIGRRKRMMSARVCVSDRALGILDASGEPIGNTQALLDLAERQHSAVGRQQPAVEFGHDRLAGHG